MRENANLLKGFVAENLAGEIKELRADKLAMAESYAKLEEFVVESLAGEIAEFAEDKNDLAETKVRLVREAKTHFAKVKLTLSKEVLQQYLKWLANHLKVKSTH